MSKESTYSPNEWADRAAAQLWLADAAKKYPPPKGDPGGRPALALAGRFELKAP